MEEVISMVDFFLNSRDTLHLSKSQMIVTLNAEMAGLAEQDIEFKKIITKAFLVVPDGIGVLMAAKFFGHLLKKRICGIELADNLLALAEKKGYGVYLLGSKGHVLDRAVNNLKSKYAGLKIVGTHHGYFQDSEERLIISEIQRKKPHIVLVGMGTPLQERWLWKHGDSLGKCVCIGVGGSFNVWAGLIPRAPLIMRRMGLEWLYRFFREPKRLFRLGLPVKYGLKVIYVSIKSSLI